MLSDDIIVVGAFSDDPLASDIAEKMCQETDISDLLSYKDFANSEFCPRFIIAPDDMDHIGRSLEGKTVVLVSSCSGELTRNARAMRNFLITRAAKDNGAQRVILVEPDLFYSAQDRGPNQDPKLKPRKLRDLKKFDGQPFSAKLYCELLQVSGVDSVMTVHNHSNAVSKMFSEKFGEDNYFNLSPASLYAKFLAEEEAVMSPESYRGFVVCAPDNGSIPFVEEVHQHLLAYAKDLPVTPSMLWMDKERMSERSVSMICHEDSPTKMDEIEGREVIVFDDMVRTGTTIAACCRRLKEARAKRVVFVVTHFNSSAEVKENLNDAAIDEIITTNTLPNILNRDRQGRLRRKMMIMKIERWIASTLLKDALKVRDTHFDRLYTMDVSRKNPRFWSTLDIQHEGDMKEGY
jgi:ribose-phosphate pyrophosphokinase